MLRSRRCGRERAILKGKAVLITGATGGIGLAAARKLAGMGARVIGVSRRPDKCSRVAEAIRAETGNRQVHFYSADLSSLGQVREVAGEILSNLPRIDVLVNNVGGIFPRRRLSEDGFERTFALNHLSGFFLTGLLMERLLESAPARIVNVSSSAQFRGRIHFDDLQMKRGYWFMKAYGQSKMANMLFTFELDRRFSGQGVTANALHPGLVKTGIGAGGSRLIRAFQRWILRGALTPEEGARTIVYLASSPDVEGVSGKFFVDRKAVEPADGSRDQEAARRLWEISAALLLPFISESDRLFAP